MSHVDRMTNIDFAVLVKLIRQGRGETQEEFARQLDVTVGTINGWENKKHRPVKAQRRRLLALAGAMKLSIPQVKQEMRGRTKGC